MPRVFPYWVAAILLAAARPAAAQRAADSLVLSLDSLLNTRISSAAKYQQTISEAASSVTIITAEDIQRHGYRTLPEALAATRGFYLSNNRAYTFLGARGFSRPSDYNNRILLLLDGNVVNEGVFGSAPIGTELGVPMESLERIEIVRGPGSALYGTGAVFAVINLITKPAEGRPRLRGAVRTGSYGARGGSLDYRGELRPGLGVSVGGTWDGSDGHDLFYPEYDAPETNSGIAHDKDWERRWSVFGQVGLPGLVLHGRYTTRTKAVPTGAYETDFVGPDTRMQDDQGVVELKLDRRLDQTRQLNARAYFNANNYRGDYFTDGEDFPDQTHYRVIGAETALHWDIASSNRLTVGGEVRHDLRSIYYWPGTPGSEIELPNTVLSTYVQDEHQVTRSLSILAGIRHDAYETSRDATSPRVAAIYTPNPSSTFKLLYGRAFRAPSLFEAAPGGEDYKTNPDIAPEKAQTFEAVWQQRLDRRVLGTVSFFHYDMNDLIEFTMDPVDSQFVYLNLSDAKAYGFEAELRGSFGGRGTGYLSYSYQEATDRATGLRLTNSPDHMVKAGTAGDVTRWLGLGVDARFESSRVTVAGTETDPAFVTDLHLLVPGRAGSARDPLRRFELSLKLNNVFDATYATPVGPEHRQAAIVQDGRNVSAELRYRF